MVQEIDLADEISAFIRDRDRLSQDKQSPWVLFAEGKFQKAFADYPSAVDHAIKSGMIGRFLVRNVSEEPARVPLVFVREPT